MSRSEELAQIVRVFAQYGFRKTSMRDLADGLGISRQALYNRFSSKEDVFEWAAQNLVETSCAACLAVLSGEGNLSERIEGAMQIWIGQHVDLVKASPHSAEIVAMVSDASSKQTEDATQSICKSMSEAIAAANPKGSEASAQDLAFVIYASAKGLLAMVGSSEEYRGDMRRIIAALDLD